MKIISIADRVEVSGTRRTADGYLVAECRVARGDNVQLYYGHEIGEGKPNQEFNIYRPADEVFRADSMASYSNKPVTNGHPEIGVTPENFRDTGVGHIGSEVIRDGEFIKVPLVVMDGRTIADIESGTREISMGYDCELVMEAGLTADGRPYDAYQKNIRINHCAIVPAGRAGPQCRIGDQSRTHQRHKEHAAMKTVTIDGKTFEVTDDVAAALSKDQAKSKLTSDTLADAVKAIEGATGAISEAKAAKDVADKIAKDAAEAAEVAKKAVPTADQLHALAAELSAVCDAAKAMAPDLDTKGMMASDIKAAAVKAALGDEAVKGKDAAYFDAAFDLLSRKTADADPVANAIRSGTTDGSKDARKAYLDSTANAWKQ